MQRFLTPFSNIRTSNRTFALLGDFVNKNKSAHNKTSSFSREEGANEKNQNTDEIGKTEINLLLCA